MKPGLLLILVALTTVPARAEDTLPMPATETLAPYSTGLILGRPVNTADVENWGLLVDILVDATGAPRAGVVEGGGFMGVGVRRTAIAWPLLRVILANNEARVVTALTADEIAAAPEYPAPAGAAIIITGPVPKP